ncbi:TraR/DksA family transcriptional regulator [Desulfurobacterium crinifex]|nr:MAG: transcriptional regulator [Desulfurobacterium sp.]
MKGNRCLTPEQIKELKEILEQKKIEVIEDIKRGLEENFQSEREVGDVVDMSTDEILKTFEMRIRDREAKYLKKIEKALQKINEGTYGICEKCGACINYERLKLRPVAELCIKCKLEQEKIERKFGEEE